LKRRKACASRGKRLGVHYGETEITESSRILQIGVRLADWHKNKPMTAREGRAIG
jgi:hypothetical protein